jgi:hypothetical protein
MRLFEQVSESTRLVKAHALRPTKVLESMWGIYMACYERHIRIGIHAEYRYLHEKVDLDRRFEHAEGILTRAKVALLSTLPVDDVPNVLHVSCLAVLILKIICVLPLNVSISVRRRM